MANGLIRPMGMVGNRRRLAAVAAELLGIGFVSWGLKTPARLTQLRKVGYPHCVEPDGLRMCGARKHLCVFRSVGYRFTWCLSIGVGANLIAADAV